LLAQDGSLDQNFNPSLQRLYGNIRVAKAQPDGKVLVGGTFNFVDTSTRMHLARLNADGTNDPTFNTGVGPDRDVYSIAIQADGKIIVGGLFKTFNGQVAGSIARLNPDGSLDTSFNCPGTVSPSNTAYVANSLVVQGDGKIVVGGNFANFNGQTANDLIRLNSDGTVDGSFSVYPIPSNGILTAMDSMADGRINIGFTYSVPPGEGRSEVVRLFPDGTLDSSFQSEVFNTGFNQLSTVVSDSSGRVLVGAVVISTSSSVSLIRLLNDGSRDLTFTGSPIGFVHAISVQADGKITIGGEFLEVNGVGRNRLARLNDDGTLDSTFNSNAPIDYNICSLLWQENGKLLVGGRQTNFPMPGVSRLTRHNPNGSLDVSFTTLLRSTDEAHVVVTQPDGKILVGGAFVAVNGIPQQSIARLNSDGSLDSTFTGRANWNVWAIALQSDGKILIGGDFDAVNGVPRVRFARLNEDGSLDGSFNTGTTFAGGNGVYTILPLPDGNILVGGHFHHPDGNAKGLVRLSSNGQIDTTFNPGFSSQSSTVRTIKRQNDGKLLIGGSFGPVHGIPRGAVARLNSNGALDTTFHASHVLTTTVLTIEVQTDGKIFLGGTFTSVVNEVERKYLIRVMPDGTLDSAFSTGTGFGNGAVASIVRQPNGRLLIGGGFSVYNDAPVNNFTRVLESGLIDSSFEVGSGADLQVNGIALQPDGNVIIGGRFSKVQGDFRSGLARLRGSPIAQTRIPFDFDGDDKTDIGIYRPNGGSGSEWWVQRSSNSSVFATQFGAPTDNVAAADYTGDGKTDVAFWRPSTGFWYVLRSEDQTFYAFPFGANGDVPVPGDYDADGKADVGVFRPSSSTWFIQRSSDNGTTIQAFGTTGDVPVNADYDGDGKADIAIYRPSAGQWWLSRSSAGNIAYQFGSPTDKTVQGDYTGDGKADVAFWRPSTGEWFILRSEDSSFFGFPFGTNGDTPVPGDYDGDGRNDAGVFRSSNNTWFINRTTAGTLIQQFGATGDQPLPNAYVR